MSIIMSIQKLLTESLSKVPDPKVSQIHKLQISFFSSDNEFMAKLIHKIKTFIITMMLRCNAMYKINAFLNENFRATSFLTLQVPPVSILMYP